jgi:translation initiation factor 3 subunit A
LSWSSLTFVLQLLRNALNVSSPEIRLLHQILEVDLHPLTICATITPIFRSLAADSTYAPYLSPLNKVLLSRLLGQLSQVYSSVRLAYITELVAPLNEPYDINPRGDGVSVEPEIWDSNKLEAYMMGCARRGELSIRIDHAEGSVTFASDVFGGSSSPVASTSSTGAVPVAVTLQSSPADLIRTRFSRLATTLSNSLLQLYPPPAAPSAAEEYATLFKAAEEERKRLAIRRTLTTRRAELLSELSVRKEKEEQSRKAEQARKDKEEENRRALEGDRRRAQERLKRELEAARKEEAKTLAKTLIAKGGLKVDAEVCVMIAQLVSYWVTNQFSVFYFS